jgi:hypothetical protein|tara:strand:- start:594 stop:893 length:300 start_codon:yes stop_codon:yes gene_type:complete
MQFFVAFHQRQVIAIQQPVDLLAAQRYHRFTVLGPAEFSLSQGFVIQYKTVIFPVQTFDLVTSAIGKCIQSAIKRIVPQFLFDNGRKPRALFTLMCSSI